MAERTVEPERARAPRAVEGVELLLDRWVSALERGEPSKAPLPQAAPPPGASPQGAAPPARNEVAARRSPERPMDTEPPPATPAPGTHPALAARAQVRLRGPVVTLPKGGQVVLAREAGRVVHPGTVAVRGPCAPALAELRALGLEDAQARALDFVLAWFGAPYDALSADAHGDVRWGAGPLPATLLADALARWERRSPGALGAQLGPLGVEVAPATPGAPAVLRVVDAGGRTVDGAAALQALADEPRLLAALAAAGRERGAQLAQLECLVEHVLRPVLALRPSGEDVRAAAECAALQGARGLALLLHAELRLGRRAAQRLVALAHAAPAGPEALRESVGPRFVAALQLSGAVREAAEARRVLASPELDAQVGPH